LDGWLLGSINVCVELGCEDDSDIDLVVKAGDIPLGLEKSGITAKEGSNASEVLHWPGIKMSNPNRRQEIYDSAKSALETAEKVEAKKIGFFTTALEIARVPSWEVAEEIVRALHHHSRNESNLDRVLLVASSPIQLSSFQYVLNNIATVIPDDVE
jgi:O-acetyl-ADP-ribose deacetylase (regulator of RNase III)